MKFRLPFTIVCTLLLLATHAFAAPTVRFGAEPSWIVKIAPQGRQPGIREVNDGYYLKLYENEINSGTDEEYVHVIRDILSDEGVQQASDISFSFDPSYERLTVHSIIVWRNGQRIDKLKKDAIKVVATEEDLKKFLYNGSYTAYVILDDIRKSDQIEYAYTRTGSNPIMPEKYYSLPMQSSDIVGQLHYRLLVPTTKTYNFRYVNDAAKPVVSNSPTTTVYDWQIRDLKPAIYSSNEPSWHEPNPYVQVSGYKNWQQVAQWGSRINPVTERLTGALGDRVAQLRASSKGDSARLFRSLVAIVQNEIRYMGVELGEHSHQAHKPEQVYAQRYGDCKDKSLLLVSMLRSVGMKAEIALVSTKNKKKTQEQLPGPDAFNHVIVVAHIGGKDIWVDPTMADQGGYGTNIYCPPYGKALIISDATDSLADIPEHNGGEMKYTEHYVIYNETSPALFTVHTAYKGYEADNERSELASKSKYELEKDYLDFYAKIYPKIERKDSVVIQDSRDSNIVQTTETYSVPNFLEYEPKAGDYTGYLYARELKNLLPQIESNYNYPIGLVYPANFYYIVHVDKPGNWDIAAESGSINREAYSFNYDVWASGSTLNITYRMTFHKDHIAASEIAQYVKDRQQIVNEYLSYSFVYESGKPSAQPVDIGTIMASLLIAGGAVYGVFRIVSSYRRRH